jgi:2-polyprenyl-3-methyl-5-hydroxy-6-metoxy-1,4-benzoquinol methylase
MSSYTYKEIDEAGHATLEVIGMADKLNEWMYTTIKPYSKGKILEIGSGIGNISAFFLEDNFEITLSDIRDNYCNELRTKFSSFSNLNGVEKIDLVHPDFEIEYAGLLNSYDTLFSLNVIEHIENDSLAIKNCYKLLKKDGRLIILVPAFQCLFNQFDIQLEHYRRYTQNTLSRIIEENSFAIIHQQYFNCAGIAGWYISGKIQRNKVIPENQIKLYNKLTFIFKLIDKLVFKRIGLSVICVGLKK